MALICSLKTLLESAGLKVGENGLVSSPSNEDWTPTMVNGRRLVLPTPAILANPDWEKTIPFHPLSEKIMRGESVVLKALRLLICNKLTYVVSALWEEIMLLAVDTDRHHLLTPVQLKAILSAPDANANTLKRLQKVITRVAPTGLNALINIYQKRGGELAGVKYNRVAVTSFPILSAMYKDGERQTFKELLGVTGLTASDSKAIAGIFDFILPGAHLADTYSAGSLSTDAPYFHSLMLAYVKIATQLNSTVSLLNNVINNPDELLIDLSWADMLDNISTLKSEIPSLRDNEGDVSDAPKTRAAGHLLNAYGNTQVKAGISVDSERVPYVAPETPQYENRTVSPVAAPAPTQVNNAEPRTSSWNSIRKQIYGTDVVNIQPHQIPSTLRPDLLPLPPREVAGYTPAGLPIYVDELVQHQPRGVYPAYGNVPTPMQSYGGRMPYPQPQYGGTARPTSSRQAANIGRAGANFPVTRR